VSLSSIARILSKVSGMRIGFSFRLLLAYFLIIGGLAWFIVHKAFDILDNSVSQAAEGIMVDSANLVAELVSQEIEDGKINLERIRFLIPAYLERNVNAQIYTVLKQKPDMQLYITDAHGTVLFDSMGRVGGEDYSQWRDVWLTLQGLYGARSSPSDPNQAIATTSDKTMYVAAPIRDAGKIVGVVSLYTEVKNLDPFVLLASSQITTYAIIVLAISVLFGWAITWLFSRSIHRLMRYADDLAEGRKVAAPKLREHELRQLADAMDHMREELENKEYVEQYIHTMAHELKSPLTSIRGAAELLQGDLSPQGREKFLNNIHESTERMTRLVERLLALASVEKRRRLENIESFSIVETINRLLNEREVAIENKQVTLEQSIPESLVFRGEKLLIEQAVANLLDNALDFAGQGGRVVITADLQDDQQILSVEDNGPGIPDFAREKIFDRFYSLPRPENQKRSTGLGLSFVREVMTLHQGQVYLRQAEQGGVVATLRWPASTGTAHHI
jgi:two-component system sensor histidine kinase CreC